MDMGIPGIPASFLHVDPTPERDRELDILAGNLHRMGRREKLLSSLDDDRI